MSFLLALSPLLVLILLLLVVCLRMHLAAGMALLWTGFITVSAWSLDLTSLGAAALKGMLLSFDILLIVFGAVVFLGDLRRRGVLKDLEGLLSSLSPDRRIQAILLAWFFGGFLEGTSGFGTPAMIVAPLLVGLGFPPFRAILVALTANSVAVSFGAVGTPLRVGFAGFELAGIAERAALLNLLAGWVVPVLILGFVVWPDSKRRKKAFFEFLPWTFFAALSFLLPSLWIAGVGPEFPSMAGGLMGLGFAVFSLRSGFLVPKSIYRFPSDTDPVQIPRAAGGLSSILPYALLIVLLVGGKFLFSNFRLNLALGGGLSHSLQVFNPGFAFLTAVFLLNMGRGFQRRDFTELFRQSASSMGRTALSICFIGAMTSLMVQTGQGKEPGLLEVIAEPLINQGLPFFSVFLGSFGAFLAGSATVSNLLFGSIQAQAAQQTGYLPALILALQLVGAAIGNMIALPNILAVSSALGVRDQESKLLRLLLPASLGTAALFGFVGFLLARAL